MSEIDIKIKDAPLSESIDGNVKFPVSDGSNLPRAATFNQVHSFVKNGLKAEGEFALVADIPTKTSQLTNDSGFAKTSDIPTDNAQLTNGKGYITATALEPYAKSADLPTDLSAFTNKAGYAKKTELPKDLGDLTNTAGYAKQTEIPTKTSQLTNNSGYLTAVPSDYPTKTEVSSSISSAINEHNSSSSAHATLIRSIAKEEVAKAADSFGIRWSLDDTVKTIEYVGNTALVEKFKNWVDTSSKPCEIKKDGSDFAYLTNTSGVASSTNWATREDGSASHYQTEDKADYLQMAELFNINIGSSINQLDRTMTVWFNTYTTCPAGFYRWFKNNSKLFARYDSTFNADATTIDACYGTSQPTGNWSFDLSHTRTKATNTNLMNITAWEIICLSWIQAAYYKSFDTQTALATGLHAGDESVARGYINGSTDTLTTPHGSISSGAFRFMYLENAFWGKQWLMGFGWRGQAGTGYLTFDDEKANKAALMDLADADVTMTYLTNTSGTYCKNVDFFTMPIEAGGSTTTGFYDGNWSNTYSDRIFYAGGYSDDGLLCGAFARSVDVGVTYAYWHQRARCAMNR